MSATVWATVSMPTAILKMRLGFYRKAIDLNSADGDYSLFQMAFTHGLMQDQQTKLSELESLEQSIPNLPIVTMRCTKPVRHMKNYRTSKEPKQVTRT